MGKLWLGIGLLLALLAFGFFVTAATETIHTPIAQNLEKAARLSLSGDLPAAAQLGQTAKTDWEKRWHFVAVFSDHAPMDEIDGLLAQLDIHAKAGAGADFAATAARIAQLVQAMMDAHKPAWWNLL